MNDAATEIDPCLRSCSRTPSLLVTMDGTRRRIADGGLFVRDSMSSSRWAQPPSCPPAPTAIIDARGMAILPGLVNTHHHLYQTLTRCLAQDDGLFGWLRDPLPHLGAHERRRRSTCRPRWPGRAAAQRLHDVQRPPLPLPQRQPHRRRDPGRPGDRHPLPRHARLHEPRREPGRPAARQRGRGRGPQSCKRLPAGGRDLPPRPGATAWCAWRWRLVRPLQRQRPT
jgi:hypothetical protein